MLEPNDYLQRLIGILSSESEVLNDFTSNKKIERIQFLLDTVILWLREIVAQESCESCFNRNVDTCNCQGD